MQYDAFKEDIAILNIYFSEPTIIRMYHSNDIVYLKKSWKNMA